MLEANGAPEVDAREGAMEGVLLAAGELGYRETSVRSILERSGGHRVQFYKDFAGKEDCFAQAYATWIERLCVSLLEAAATAPGWEGGVRAAIARLFELVVARPAIARALLVEVQIAGEPALARHEAAVQRLAATVDGARAEIDPAEAPPEATGVFVVGGIESCAAEALTAGEPARVWDALPELMHLAAGSYFGKEAAEGAFERASVFLERERERWAVEADRGGAGGRPVTELRLISGAALAEPEASEAMSPLRLSPGRHGMPADLVRAHQRRRLLEAAAAALAEQGYGRLTAARVTELAHVSSRTFYQHFEDLWACVLAAYEEQAARLCDAIETAYAAPTKRGRGLNRAADQSSTAGAGIAAAIEFLAAEPDVARLLSAEPPPQIAALAGARRELIERLGAMLRSALAARDGATPLPGLERRLISAALAIVASRAAGGDPQRLRELEPELTELLLASL